ncbi:MAG: NADH-quinone oxidoreductase subunit J [Anaerolineales bacterium]|jgi:NADH-quinone oxidoreductase subunit J
MTITQIVFLVVSVTTILAAILVVTSHKMIHAALWLVLSLGGVAVLFVLLQASFLAVVQIVIYVGAIAILIIFVVMLTRRMMYETGSQVNRYWWIGAVAALLLFAGLVVMLGQIPAITTLTDELPIPEGDLLSMLGTALVDVNSFVLPFEVASVLLLAALIGSLVVARPLERRAEEGDER